jgi:hypothetical protein
MIIGHIGVAFAARSRWPRTSLAWLLVATMAPDLLRAALGVGGMSMAYSTRYSHVLPWSALLAAALGVAALAATRRGVVALLTTGVVLSHIALDAVSGHKALWDGGPAGLDVQHYQQLELVIEGALAWWGWWLLRKSAAPTWMARRSVLGFLLAFETVYLAVSLWQRPYATRCIEYPVRPCEAVRGLRP